MREHEDGAMSVTSNLRSRLARILPQGEPVHSIPVFEGPKSRRHRTVSLRHLHVRAIENIRRVPALLRADTVVLFAGYPRSGHSLVGALIDAHPNAVAAHELDVLGLVRLGLRWPEIVALIDDNSRRFRTNGRWWNGYAYDPEHELPPGAVQVIGDKKGDWAVRHLLEEPTVLDLLQRRVGRRRIVFVIVTRNPFDNVATMSLRKSRRYDKLRIETGDNQRRDLPTEVSDEMVDDYGQLSAGVSKLAEQVDTLVIAHEDLVGDPRGTIRRLYEGLGLPATDEVVDSVAGLVSPRPNETRHRVAWTDRQVDQLVETMAEAPHLASYLDSQRPTPRDPEFEVSLVSCVGVDGGVELLPAFLDHYADLGIPPDNMHVILNASDVDSPGLADARVVLEERGVAADHVWIGPYHSLAMWNRRRELQQRQVGLAGWVVNADVDEFNVFPDGLEPVIQELHDHGYLGVQAPMIDRIAADSSLPTVDPAMDPFEQFPQEGDLMTRLPQDVDLAEGAGTGNLVLHAACVLPSGGGHGVSMERTREWLRDVASQEGCSPRDLLEHPAIPPQVQRRWRHVLNNRLHLLHGTHLRNFPRLRDSQFRFTFPIYSAHFKWHAGFRRDLEQRVARGDQSSGAARYSLALLEHFRSHDWRIPPDTFLPRRDPRPTDWRSHAESLRAYRQAIRPALGPGHRQRSDSAQGMNGWSIRQLTVGTGTWSGHMHCYYDIQVLNTDETRLVAIEVDHHNSPIRPDDQVRVGTVDLADGGFVPLATTTAWSWQQGPMAQWIPGQDRIVFNVRDGDGLAATVMDPTDPTRSTPLSRPIYALASHGRWGVSIDLLRLDGLRPGYGYTRSDTTGGIARAPTDDGIWRIDLTTDESHLVLSIGAAVDATITALEERNPSLATQLRQEDHHFWFNHLKLSPDDRRLTCKLRWRHPDGPWSDHQGVSLTVDMEHPETTTPHLLATATSHVMWWTSDRLYYWDAAARDVMVVQDQDDAPPRPLRVGQFDRNVHLRHVVEQPTRFVYDEPYQENVTLHQFDLESGESTQLARFPFHTPARGLYRCDLHPVPTRRGDQIIVTSLTDGRRQVHVVEQERS